MGKQSPNERTVSWLQPNYKPPVGGFLQYAAASADNTNANNAVRRIEPTELEKFWDRYQNASIRSVPSPKINTPYNQTAQDVSDMANIFLNPIGTAVGLSDAKPALKEMSNYAPVSLLGLAKMIPFFGASANALRRPVGRIITNLVKPVGYELPKIKFNMDSFKSIVDDVPLYEGKRVLEREVPYRTMYDLEPRFGTDKYIYNGIKNGERNFSFSKSADGLSEIKEIQKKYYEQVKHVADNAKSYFRLKNELDDLSKQEINLISDYKRMEEDAWMDDFYVDGYNGPRFRDIKSKLEEVRSKISDNKKLIKILEVSAPWDAGRAKGIISAKPYHSVLGGYDLKPFEKTYYDRWDMTLNDGEKIIYRNPETNKITMNKSNALRWWIDKLTNPVTISGKL